MSEHNDNLNVPGKRKRGFLPHVSMDSDSFGNFAERVARFMGSGKFILYMTIFIVIWIAANVITAFWRPWDPYPFILLNLCFSTQASYSAPLILLAQNRQEARDRVSIEHDRQVTAQARADTDFLARELASLRSRVNDLATRDFIRSELRTLLEELESDKSSEKEEDKEAEHS
ncbi:MAG: DUF1003 domain-containing protein [Propionibacteriaceae bacterium]|nr:DUF1003 domain-containing protein [Propionibacteriaceae bacterium]